VISIDWMSYPILRFKECPSVTVGIVYPGGYLTTTPGAVGESVAAGNVAAVAQGWASSGAGEAASVPPAPAVANAFFDATGVRIPEVPMTPARVRSDLEPTVAVRRQEE